MLDVQGKGTVMLIDVSRLIWRVWSGRLPTGIDRVCLAYVEHFGERAQAVIQYKGKFLVLSRPRSKRLFETLANWRSPRAAIAWQLAGALVTARRKAPRGGMVYLNVGHTGLDHPALPKWIARNRLRAIFLVHDLIPLTHPKYCRPGESDKHARRMDNVLRSASGVIANSRATRDALAHYAHSRGAKLPPTIAALISGNQVDGSVQPKRDGRPYFVAVGTIEGRKNHLLLLRVWHQLAVRLKDEAPRLVIIGQRGWEAEEAIGLLDSLGELEEHVTELDACGDDELHGWIAGARALLMPSFVEGFGLPIIEALQLGTPVIASDLPVYRELAGEIPAYLDPSDDHAWEHLVRGFIGDCPERTRQLTLMRRYKAPDWAGHFRKVEAWLSGLQATAVSA